MRLSIGKTYRIYLSDGSSHAATVLSYEGDEWYKVKAGGAVFFINLNQAAKVYEE